MTLTGARLRATDPARDRKPLVPLPAGSPRAANILVAGVGGTGVVTVSQILGTAAHLDGNHVSTLDMTGLAQKGGAVVSHVRISPAGMPHPPTRIPPMGADTLIGADAVTAASIDVLGLTSPTSTSVILNTHLAPTAEFVLRQRQGLDFGRLEKRLEGHVRRLVAVDANAATQALSDPARPPTSSCSALLPGGPDSCFPTTALKRAITLNGVAVEQNLAAFHHGRAAAHRRESPRAGSAVRPNPSVSEAMQPPGPAGLDDRIATRSAFLREYQDQALAARYEDLVDESES